MEQTILAVATLAAVGVLIDSAETVTQRRSLDRDFDLRILSTTTERRMRRTLLWSLVDSSPVGLTVWQALRVAGALTAIVGATAHSPPLLAVGA